MFDQLIESRPNHSRHPREAVLLSIALHGMALIALAAVPLIFYQSLPDREFLTFLPAVPRPAVPPTPLPPRPAKPSTPPSPAADVHKFTPPEVVPEGVHEPPPDLHSFSHWLVESSLDSSVPGGVVGPSVRWAVPEGIVPPLPDSPGTPPPDVKEPTPIGGDVQSSKLIHRVNPSYPRMARFARVEGPVVLRAVIDKEGAVTELRVISGKRLLREAALKAVSQWRYSPTLLNGEAVPVVTTVTVIFKLR